jgi:uncharacterized membrane protein
MMAYVLNHNERFVIHSNDPMWNHYQSFKWWLLPHVLMGACALFLGPMQFSDRLRLRYTKLHRVVGRVYVAGVLIAEPLGAFIQYRFDERLGVSRSFTIATIVDASLWMLTTAIALVFALNGKIQQHRQWMTRSYAVAIVFLESRVIAGLGGWENPVNGETIIWVWSTPVSFWPTYCGPKLIDLPETFSACGADAVVLDKADAYLSLVPMLLGMPYTSVSQMLFSRILRQAPLCQATAAQRSQHWGGTVHYQ